MTPIYNQRIQIGIARDHSHALITQDGTELILPLSSWSTNGALQLNLPWALIDLVYPYDDKDVEVTIDNDEFGEYPSHAFK